MQENISVLIPAFNREQYIGQCLESILSQTCPPVEVIVYDDGSTDRTAEIVKSFSPIRLIKGEKNCGASYARNQLLGACTTRYAAWQDSDDLSNIYRLEEQYRLLKDTGKAIAFGYCVNLRHQPAEAWKNKPASDPRYTTQCFAGSMFDREQASGIFFEESVTMGGEDLLWIKALEKAAGERVVIPKQLYYVRMHPDRIGQWKRKLTNRKQREQSDRAYFKAIKKLDS